LGILSLFSLLNYTEERFNKGLDRPLPIKGRRSIRAFLGSKEKDIKDKHQLI
jgi:hypothetical protein